MQIRTDDEVYRVDAVWLGPPRATFPWRARYSAYGVGLLVMIVVMFLQRRLGIDLGFFSVAWALLITVVVTRFVSRRINDERPLLEWLTLFSHELRGPRARTRTVGGALGTGHVRIHRDRPHGAPTPIALPPGSTPAGARGVVGPRSHSGGAHAVVPPPRGRARPDATPAPDTPERSEGPRTGPTVPAHRARRPASRPTESSGSGPRRRRQAEAGFGPPSATEVGEPVPERPSAPSAPSTESTQSTPSAPSTPADATPALPPAPPPDQTAAAMAAWTTPVRERTPARPVTASRAAAPPWAPNPSPGGFGPGARRRAPWEPAEDTEDPGHGTDDGARA